MPEALNLRDLAEVIDIEAPRPPSPVTPEEQSRAQSPETPGPTQSPRQVRFDMSTAGGQSAGSGQAQTSNDPLQDILQILVNQRGERTGRTKVEDPELFYGERTKLRAFLVQCELKFNCESSKFVTHAEKVNYASARCRGAAWKWIEPSIVEGTSKYDIWAEFKAAIQ